MTITVVNIIPRKLAEASQTTQYTSTAMKTSIDKFSITNNTATPQTFAVNLVASGGSASSSNIVLPTKTIAAGECYLCPEITGQTLEAGGFISTIASANTMVLSASGRQIT